MNQSKWKCEAREKKDAYPTVTMWYVHKEQQLPPHFFDIFKSKWLHGKLASSLFIPPPQSSTHILDIILFKNLLDHIAGFYRLYYNSFTIVFLFYNHLYFSYMFRQALVTPHSATITKGKKKVKTCIWPFSHTICLLSVHFTYCYRTGRWSYATVYMHSPVCFPIKQLSISIDPTRLTSDVCQFHHTKSRSKWITWKSSAFFEGRHIWDVRNWL